MPFYAYVIALKVSTLGLALVGIKVVEQEVVILTAIFKVSDNFLLLANLYSEATTASVIEDVLIVFHHVSLSR